MVDGKGGRMQSLQQTLEVASEIAREAGRLILEVYGTQFEVEHKPKGGGPVTLADQQANAFIEAALRRAFPGDAIVTEEAPPDANAAEVERCWFVDPMDGTAEFVDRNGMFAVQLGLAVRGEPVLGVVYAPVLEKLYAATAGGECVLHHAGERRVLRVAPSPADPSLFRVAVSRSHKSKKTEAICKELGITRFVEHGSVGLKCGLLAEGLADVYLHPSDRSYRWDSCGPEVILRAAGGVVTNFAGDPYRYDARELRNTRGLIGASPAAYAVVAPVARRIAEETGLLK